jgi:hypothetical protein
MSRSAGTEYFPLRLKGLWLEGSRITNLSLLG